MPRSTMIEFEAAPERHSTAHAGASDLIRHSGKFAKPVESAYHMNDMIRCRKYLGPSRAEE